MTKRYRIALFSVGLVALYAQIPQVASGDGAPDCDPGYYIDGFSCEPCPEGRYSTNGDGTECLPCDVGTYQPNEGAESCIQCAPNTFTAFTESTECTECPAGYRSGEGAIQCVKVTVGKRSSINKEDLITDTTSPAPEEGENQGDLLETTTADSTTDSSSSDDTTPYTLTTQEITRVTGIAQRIIILIEASNDPEAMYETAMQLLESRLAMYTKKNDQKNIALVKKLMEILENHFE